MPFSPCDHGCVDPARPVGLLRTAARAVSLLVLMIGLPAVLVAPRRIRARLNRRYGRMLLRCCGLTLRIVDERGERTAAAQWGVAGGGLLVVAGHVSWTDVVVLNAVAPMSFIARGDMIAWPLLGGLARLNRVIPIHRERLRELPQVIETVSQRLAAGERITGFPEGTTWCGRAHGRMRPALFQAAVNTATPVQPVRLRYLDRYGRTSSVPAFVGTDTFVSSGWRVLRANRIVAEVTVLPVEQPGTDRRELAHRCAHAVHGESVDMVGTHFDPDAHTASTYIGSPHGSASVGNTATGSAAPRDGMSPFRASVAS